MNPFNISDDYVDVATRIQLFYDRYPEGRLTTVEHGQMLMAGSEFVYCKAAAYRSADDEQPCHGIAWEPVPGPTPFTKNSELMNAETSAWGRAIIAAGIPAKKIASAEEVQARQMPAEGSETPPKPSEEWNSVNRTLHAVCKANADRGATPPEYLGQFYETWNDYSKAVALNKWGKHSRRDLTPEQMRELVKDVEAAGVPF